MSKANKEIIKIIHEAIKIIERGADYGDPWVCLLYTSDAADE